MIVEDEYDPFSPIAKLRDICPSLMTSSDLLSLEIPEINWVIPKLLPAGLALLAGEPKIGKSYFLLKLAKDITENGGKVFYFAGEDSSYLLQKRLKELDLDVGEDLIVHCGRDSLLSEPSKFKGTIEQMLSIQRFDAIFLDNMEMVLPAKGKGSDDYAYYYKQLPPWAMLASKHNCTILMTHHTKKEREDNPFKTILGSQAIMGCCDSVFVMERSDQPNQFTLHATGKFTEDLALNLKREECLFKFDGSHYEAKLKKNSGQYMVYEYVRDHPDCFQKQIAENAGIKKQIVSRNIKILVARGYVVGNNNIGFRITRMLDDLDDSDDQ